MVGAGGLAANAEDLCRFTDMFSGKGKQIFSQSSLNEMKKTQPSAFAGKLQAGEMSFGLGWDITNIAQYQAKGIQVIGKSGGTGNYASMVLTVPAQRISVAVIETGPGSSAVEIASDMLADLLESQRSSAQ